MRTTKRELIEMLENLPDDAEIVLRVRGNSTTDYSEQEIAVKTSTYEDFIYIVDKMSE